MEILLLTDIPGIGKKDDLIVVGDGFALNKLLPRRMALVATPNVRKRYADQIKRRAELRKQEEDAKTSAMSAIEGKTVTLARKATKTGKLYAAITADIIAETIKEQLNTDVDAGTITIDEQIKSVGKHTITIGADDGKATMTVNVEEEKA